MLTLDFLPLTCHVGDTAVDVELVVTGGLPDEIATATAAVWITRESDGVHAVAGAQASILDVAADGRGSKSARLLYRLGVGDLATPGRHVAVFRITYASGETRILPDRGRLVIHVRSTPQ